MSNLFWLSDAQMARLEPFFPKSHGKPHVDDRRVLSHRVRGVRRRSGGLFSRREGRALPISISF